MTAAAEPAPSLPLLPGYAPKLCLAGPAHYAARDPAIPDRIVWRCMACQRAWTTSGEEVP